MRAAGRAALTRYADRVTGVIVLTFRLLAVS
jgi:hypothetical protein